MPKLVELNLPKEFVVALQEKADGLLPGESAKVGLPCPEQDLRNALHGIGLHRVRKWAPKEPQEGWSYLQAFKPDLSPVRGVTAIMSLPRYGLCSTFGAVTNALLPLRIPLKQGFGVYWSEVMTELMAGLVDECEYILTIDYDTIFDVADVRLLIQLMNQTPDAGAICGVQMRRTKPTPLLVMKDGASQVPLDTFDDDLTEVLSAHFGLTLIRTECLKKLKKPWFQAVPDKNGEWKVEAGVVAADVAFWFRFAEQGFKLYQANYVAIGHVEEMCIWPDRTLRPIYQNINDYRKNGVPDEALR